MLALDLELISFLDFLKPFLKLPDMLALLTYHLGALLVNYTYSLFVRTSFSNFILQAQLRLTDEQVLFDPALNVHEEMLKVVIDLTKTLYYVVSISDQLLATTVSVALRESVLKLVDIEPKFFL
jgi:hypothetical protein